MFFPGRGRRLSVTQSTSLNTGEINTPCSPPSSPGSPSAITLSLFAFGPVYCPGKAAALSSPSVWAPHFTGGLIMMEEGLLTDFLRLAGGPQIICNVASSAPVTTQQATKPRTRPWGQACPRSPPLCDASIVGLREAWWLPKGTEGRGLSRTRHLRSW